MTIYSIFIVYFMAEILFERNILSRLIHWLNDPACPGLILYGARQTGKTSLAIQLGSNAKQFIKLDLTEPANNDLFRRSGSIGNFLDTLSLVRGIDARRKGTLICFDSLCIQPELLHLAGEILSAQPGIKVMVTSACLLHQIPRGFCVETLRPFSFTEFLKACGSKQAVTDFDDVPFPVHGFHELLRLFHTYSLCGGMPAVVNKFSQTKSLTSLRPVYESILTSFLGSIDSSRFRQAKKDLISITLQNAFMYAGTRIRFNEFGNVPFGSREMGNAFRFLQNLMLIQLIYPSVTSVPPIEADENKLPRLQILDTGLVTYFSGIQKHLAPAQDLSNMFEGQVLRHIVGQELLANASDGDGVLSCWVRDKAQSRAEVDYLVRYEDLVIPVVVRSGEPGRLRSLHQFIDQAPHPYGIRLYAGNVSIRKTSTLKGKPFYLLSLPYFLACRIPEHLKGFIMYVGS